MSEPATAAAITAEYEGEFHFTNFSPFAFFLRIRLLSHFHLFYDHAAAVEKPVVVDLHLSFIQHGVLVLETPVACSH